MSARPGANLVPLSLQPAHLHPSRNKVPECPLSRPGIGRLAGCLVVVRTAEWGQAAPVQASAE